MSETLWIAIGGVLLSGLSAWFAAWFAGRSSVKVKEIDIESAAYARAEQINDNLFKNLRKQIEDLQEDVRRIDGELEAVKGHNNALISFCYRLIAIIRRGGNEEDIPNPPHGIYL